MDSSHQSQAEPREMAKSRALTIAFLMLPPVRANFIAIFSQSIPGARGTPISHAKMKHQGDRTAWKAHVRTRAYAARRHIPSTRTDALLHGITGAMQSGMAWHKLPQSTQDLVTGWCEMQ